MVVVYPPLTEHLPQEAADDLAARGLFGDSVPALRTAWENVCVMWDDVVDRARRLPAAALDESVGGEWSFIQTIRHLIFVLDVWHREIIEGAAGPHHPWGMPPDFRQDAAAALGLDLGVRPSLDAALDVWHHRRAAVTDYLGSLTETELARTCAPRGGAFQVVGALQTIVSETWSHLQYATRDLAALEGGR